jgi:hypothetical protein
MGDIDDIVQEMDLLESFSKASTRTFQWLSRRFKENYLNPKYNPSYLKQKSPDEFLIIKM